MIRSIDQCYYLPIHRWKLGEAQSLGSISPEVSDRVLPLFEIPPSSGWDYEALKVFTAAEHIKHFGTRLNSLWPGRPVLVDASTLDRPTVREELMCHPLTALLERARQGHSHAYPVVSLKSTPEYLNAARDFLVRNDYLGFCLRFELASFDSRSWAVDIEQVVQTLSQRPEKGVLLVDAGAIESWDDHFVSLVIERINQIPHLLKWAGLFFASTSFPERRSTAIGTTGRFPRSDSKLYRAIVSRQSELLRIPRFSDYGPSYPSPFRRGGGIPKAHLRFTAGNDYLVAEGPSTKGKGFKAIHPVASNLVSQVEFVNHGFSQGSRYFSRLADEDNSPGNPSKWRWGAADHHTVLAVTEQAALHGLTLLAAEAESESTQMAFPILSAVKTDQG